MPKVLNFYHKPASTNVVYIGRPKGNVPMHYGNPFTHIHGSKAAVIVGSRAEAVKAFRDWLAGKAWPEVEPERRLWILKHLPELRNKDLLCWCAPAQCHGDTLIELANL